MRLLACVVLAACYAPAPQPGSSCADGPCPSSLVCSPETLTCERMPDPSDGGGGEAGRVDAAIDAAIDAPKAASASCKALLDDAPLSPNGTYTIDPDGPGGTAPFSVYCNMTMGAGGWTLAMALAIDATGLTWTNLVPSYAPPQTPSSTTTNVLHHSTLAPMGVRQMVLMGGNRIIKFYYPRAGGNFTTNYRNLTERAAFRTESDPLDGPHSGGSRDVAGCGHLNDACTTTDYAKFLVEDSSCPRDATNSSGPNGCGGTCSGVWGTCPQGGVSPPVPTPNCWYYGGSNATLMPNLSSCPVASRAPWGEYATGTMTGFYTLWVR